MRNVRFSCVLEPNMKKLWPIEKSGITGSTTRRYSQAVQYSVFIITVCFMFNHQGTRTSASWFGGGGILTHWLKNEHYLRDIYKWHRQLSAPRKLIFVTKRVKTFHAFSLTLHARPINVEFDCIPKVAILFVQRHVRAALRSSRPHLCRPRFGRTHGPVVRQVRNEWMNVLMNEWRKEGMCSHH